MAMTNTCLLYTSCKGAENAGNGHERPVPGESTRYGQLRDDQHFRGTYSHREGLFLSLIHIFYPYLLIMSGVTAAVAWYLHAKRKRVDDGTQTTEDEDSSNRCV